MVASGVPTSLVVRAALPAVSEPATSVVGVDVVPWVVAPAAGVAPLAGASVGAVVSPVPVGALLLPDAGVPVVGAVVAGVPSAVGAVVGVVDCSPPVVGVVAGVAWPLTAAAATAARATI